MLVKGSIIIAHISTFTVAATFVLKQLPFILNTKFTNVFQKQVFLINTCRSRTTTRPVFQSTPSRLVNITTTEQEAELTQDNAEQILFPKIHAEHHEYIKTCLERPPLLPGKSGLSKQLVVHWLFNMVKIGYLKATVGL